MTPHPRLSVSEAQAIASAISTANERPACRPWLPDLAVWALSLMVGVLLGLVVVAV